MDQEDKFSDAFYELQFYRFFLSDVSDIVKELMEDAVVDTSTGFSKVLTKFDEETKQQVLQALANKYKEAINRSMPMIHAEVKKHLGVKKHILLPQDEINRTPVTEADELELFQKRENLLKKYFALQSMSRTCSNLIQKFNQTKEYTTEIDNISKTIVSFKKSD